MVGQGDLAGMAQKGTGAEFVFGGPQGRGAQLGMGSHHRPFLVGEFAGLQEDGVGDAHLAHIVQRRRLVDELDRLVVEFGAKARVIAQLHRQRANIALGPQDVRAGLVVTGLGQRGERQDRDVLGPLQQRGALAQAGDHLVGVLRHDAEVVVAADWHSAVEPPAGGRRQHPVLVLEEPLQVAGVRDGRIEQVAQHDQRDEQEFDQDRAPRLVDRQALLGMGQPVEVLVHHQEQHRQGEHHRHRCEQAQLGGHRQVVLGQRRLFAGAAEAVHLPAFAFERQIDRGEKAQSDQPERQFQAAAQREAVQGGVEDGETEARAGEQAPVERER